MDADQLFLETLSDLEARLGRGKPEYEILQIAGLLRKLLLDGQNSLVDQVNRERRLRVRYRINQRSVIGMAELWWLGDGLDPETCDPTRLLPLQASRDQLLARPVLALRGCKITVKDLIVYSANVAGSVHLSAPRPPKERIPAEVSGALPEGQLATGETGTSKNPAIRLEVEHQSGFISGCLHSLRAVGRVVLCGLEPLRTQVLSERQPS